MDNYERARIGVFDVIRKICRNNYAVLSTYAPFVTIFTDFESKVDELDDWLVKQAGQLEGASYDKSQRRLRLIEDAGLLSSLLYVYAVSAGLTELMLRTKYSPTVLKHSGDRKLTGICYQLHQDGLENIAALAPFMIDAAWLNAFLTKINGFSGVIGSPAAARAVRKKATEEIKRLVPEIAFVLRHKLDPVMDYFKLQDSLLYANYRNGRKMISPPTEKPALKGKVSDTEGKPLKGLQVTIAGTQRKSITTALGNFRFKRLADGKYTLIVKEKKKEVARQVVDVPVNGEVGIIIN